ncbi:hypothetical protein BLOT_011249 [Blomia tropicalis]|nr:hypothetical protein BLOT_011249 [Blomia tropicalis]
MVHIWGHAPPIEIALKSTLVFMICLVGLISNLLVILIVLRQPKIRQHTVNIYIVNLAIADFLTTLFTPIDALVTNIFQNYELGPVMCKLEIFIKMMCILAGIFSVMAIAVQRFVTVRHPISTNTTRSPTHPRTLFIITGIWIISIMLAMPLSIWRTYQQRQWKDYLEKWCTDDPPKYSIYYWIIVISPLMYIPLIVMIIVYWLMIGNINRFIRKLKQTEYGHTTESATTTVTNLEILEHYHHHNETTNNNNNNNNTHIVNRQMMSANMHIRSIMITIIIYCLITFFMWLPLQVLVYYRALKPKQIPMIYWYESVKFGAQMLCSINSAINPFVTFRKTFIQIYYQLRSRSRRKHLKQMKLIRNKLTFNEPCVHNNEINNDPEQPTGTVIPMQLLQVGSGKIESLNGKTNTATSHDVDEDRNKIDNVEQKEEEEEVEEVEEVKTCNDNDINNKTTPTSGSIYTHKLTKHVLMKYTPELFADNVP